MSRLLKVQEAADAHRVEPETIRRWIREGRLPATRNPAGHYRIVEEDLPLALEPARRTSGRLGSMPRPSSAAARGPAAEGGRGART